ncbi:MAG: hypothetical protein A3B24_00775 [Candidatus Wildermuthbacteria bacterium RIFCSPLOWO2_01_FULL_48_16]|uniref:Fibronectin type-III domain-containing protein n=1 Tax=Candidatus Wildermuthbacteria bacterium RIFCSPLOWO2_01_FULL_48_16 TaxID=1802461 RepID=A0A1G2RJY3_9BACT|nr:MAG: hypothetical protein A3B24_00775 [Candidatus Wildermuthbacteria bacterium RIFCSPLOWO2_01_FULL_48_16]
MRFSLIVFVFAIFLLFGFTSNATAGECKYIGDSPPIENSNDCDIIILYTDPGGAELASCRYKIVTSGTNPGDPSTWNTDWTSGICAGSFATMTKTIQIPESFSAGLYDVHWYAQDNSNNTAQGLFDTFKVVTAPTVTTQAATDIIGTQATLNGDLTSLGGAANATVWFEWGTTVSYGNSTTPVTKTSTGTFNASITNLVGGTTYHFRAVAQNFGTAYGADQQFTTLDINAPRFQSFIINGVSCSDSSCPATVTASTSVDITWSAVDPEGSPMTYEIWRTQDPNDWGLEPHISNAASPFSEIPPAGTYWYGVHATDSAGNCITEDTDGTNQGHCGGVGSDSYDDPPLGPRTSRGPIKVIFGDQEFPTISSFVVSPRPPSWVNKNSPNVSVSWTVSDNASLKEVTILRCDKSIVSQCAPSDWQNIRTIAAPPGSTNWSGALSPQDTPPEGKSWYGMHVWDNAGHKTVEPPPGPLDVQIDKTPPNTPTLGTPFDQSTVNTENPTFTWNAASDPGGSGVASYYIQVDNNQNFNNPEVNQTGVTSTQYISSPNLTHAGYYWHVSAERDNAGNESSDYSGSWFFYIELNEPPNASFNCTPANCTVYANDIETLTFNNNSSDPDGNITDSEWDILNYGTAPDATCSGVCNHTLQQIAPNSYTMHLLVRDNAGASDTDTKGFTVRRDIVAGFMCSLDNVNFVACASLSGKVSQGEILYLKDSSSLSEYTIVSQNANSVTSRTWKINGNTFSSGNNANPSTTIPTEGTVTLELEAQDNQSRSDTQTHVLNPQVPFPEFQECSPFGCDL